MNKIWGVVVCMLLLANTGYASRAVSDETKSKVQVSGNVTVTDITPADTTVEPCEPPSELRTSDLCAQWKAADAASVAANAAKIANEQMGHANWIAAGAAVLSFTAMIAALASAWFSMRTLHAERAWLTVPPNGTPSITASADSRGRTTGVEFNPGILWENSGRSPALDVQFAAKMIRVEPNDVPKPPSLPLTGYGAPLAMGHKIHPGITMLSQHDLRDFVDGKCQILIYSICSYKTVFDVFERRGSTYCTLLKVTQGKSIDGRRTINVIADYVIDNTVT